MLLLTFTELDQDQDQEVVRRVRALNFHKHGRTINVICENNNEVYEAWYFPTSNVAIKTLHMCSNCGDFIEHGNAIVCGPCETLETAGASRKEYRYLQSGSWTFWEPYENLHSWESLLYPGMISLRVNDRVKWGRTIHVDRFEVR